MERICLFPGTFDPVTLGHVDVIERAVSMFDKLIIGVGINSSKQPMFTIEQRTKWISEIFANDSRVEVTGYEGLTVDFCRKVNAHYVLRGMRILPF